MSALPPLWPAGRNPPASVVLAVASGKGGVGKSTVSLNLALALRELTAGRVGLLDADFYGPDIPVMVNLTRREPLRRWSLWQPSALRLPTVERFGLRIASVGFLLGEEQAFPWTADTLVFVARQLLFDVEWGDLDHLVVDLPPGTGDLQQQLFRVATFTGAVVVVTPQDVAHLDAKKLLSLLADARVPVLGGVENMSALVCPHCGETIDVFPAGPAERSIWSDGVRLLGRVPLDPSIAAAAGRGQPVLARAPDSDEARAFREIARELLGALSDSRG